MKSAMANEYTPETLANACGCGVDNLRIKYASLQKEGHPLFVAKFSRTSQLSPDQVQILRPGFKADKNTDDRLTKTAQGLKMFNPLPSLQAIAAPAMWRTKIFVIAAFGLVVVHAGLVWYDMAFLWGMPGKIGGGVVFTFIFSGMVLMSEKSPEMGEIRDNMLWAVGALEALAVVVHHGVFYRHASEAYAAGMGEVFTWGIASVICLCSIGATVFYQKTIAKKTTIE